MNEDLQEEQGLNSKLVQKLMDSSISRIEGELELSLVGLDHSVLVLEKEQKRS